MDFWPAAGLWTLWAAWLTQAILSLLLVRKFFVRRISKGSSRSLAPHTPPAIVIVPFKDVDLELAQGVRSLCEQDYPHYRLLCVVESQDDPAYNVLRQELARHPQRCSEIIVSGCAPPNQGQKVHNQLVALAAIEGSLTGDEVLVFADSDAVMGEKWLRQMVAPLGAAHTGVSTGYRWLVPAGERPTLCSHLASIINSSAACFYGRPAFNHAWGGSMAVSVANARLGKLQDRLRGALTDDYPMTRMCRELGRSVYFVPECLVPSPVDFTWATLRNFAFRQYLITRVYQPWIYYGVMAVLGLYVAGMLTAWGALAWSLYRGDGQWLIPAGVILAVGVANMVRSHYRGRVIDKAFDEPTRKALTLTRKLDCWTTGLWMTLHLALMLPACFSRQMTWRGIRYRLLAPQHVERLPR